jgi:hypothetical protein
VRKTGARPDPLDNGGTHIGPDAYSVFAEFIPVTDRLHLFLRLRQAFALGKITPGQSLLYSVERSIVANGRQASS